MSNSFFFVGSRVGSAGIAKRTVQPARVSEVLHTSEAADVAGASGVLHIHTDAPTPVEFAKQREKPTTLAADHRRADDLLVSAVSGSGLGQPLVGLDPNRLWGSRPLEIPPAGYALDSASDRTGEPTRRSTASEWDGTNKLPETES